ncbi:MAG: MATE family efflux transporter [Spirochaetaceae bacterium]|jgi:putative MATE family efflux protein|nr:MATE family efflux transporter [Spirochaetaceae bacterium]
MKKVSLSVSPASAGQWNNRSLFRLLWPLIVEQILGVTMGVADTVMVSRVGEHAVSGISIVDVISILLINAFTALATGGAVVVSQYIGRKDTRSASLASKQLIYINTFVSLTLMTFTLLLCRPLLRLIYGHLDDNVMRAAQTYFLITAFSFPALAIYNSNAALFRSAGNSRITMLVALLVNILNIGGNALLIYVYDMGVAGAALSTLVSRSVAAVLTMALLLSGHSPSISLKGIFKIKLRFSIIRSILNVGIPSGLENSMFQLGKILVSRIVTHFGTVAIAANAVTNVVNSMSFMPGQAFGMALLTVVGQCVGARDYANAKKYTAKLIKQSYMVMFICCFTILLCRTPLVSLFNLSPDSRTLAKQFLFVYGAFTPFFWPLSFALPNSLKAAGDAKYCMTIAGVSMWVFRVLGAHILAYAAGLGALGVWCSMILDFCFRAVCYTRRWIKGRWMGKTVIVEGK